MANDDRRPLGRILLDHDLLSPSELDAALDEQRRSPKDSARPLASILIERGVIDALDALRALSEQCGVPGIDLAQVAIRIEHLEVIPPEVATLHRILPVLVRGDRIFVAMADPKDSRVIDELEFVTGKKVYAYVALRGSLERTIKDAYEAARRGARHYVGPNAPDDVLRQLGVPPRADSTPPIDLTRKTRTAAPESRRAAPTGKPPSRQGSESPPIVLDEATDLARRDAEISTSEFGRLGSEVSSVSSLPEELRVRASQAAGVAKQGDGKLVLVVDDEEEIRKLVSRLLISKGHRVIEADRGLVALRLVKEHVPDLIILDAMLPELHGFDIARRIKGSGKYGAIPIIMVSAVYRGWRIAEDLKSSYGIDAYLEKPFKIAELWAEAARLLAPKSETGEPPPSTRDPEQISAQAETALNAGVAAYQSGDIDRAIERLQHGVTLDPLAYRLHFHLALLYGKKGQIYEGIQELERAIDLNPRHFPALKNLAVLYEKAGFKHKAIETWERSLAWTPDDATRETVKQRLLKLL